jgi:hypothetical protein
MTTVRLALCPEFTTVRTKAGAFAADSATLSDTNFPPEDCIVAPGRNHEVIVYWDASGGSVGPHDFVDLELLMRDGSLVTPAWTTHQVVLGVKQKEVKRFQIVGASHVYIRVAGVSCASGTGLTIRAALVPLG